MLFRSAENYGSEFSGGTFNTFADSVPDTFSSAASLLWAEDTTAAIADTGGELTSDMTAVSNAMLTPWDNTNAYVTGSDTLYSGLFPDSKNKNFLG